MASAKFRVGAAIFAQVCVDSGSNSEIMGLPARKPELGQIECRQTVEALGLLASRV